MTIIWSDRVELTEEVESPETGRRFIEGTEGVVVDHEDDSGLLRVELEVEEPGQPDGLFREVLPLPPDRLRLVERGDFDAVRDHEWRAFQSALEGDDPREVARRVVSYRRTINWNHEADVLMPAARDAADALEDGDQDDLVLACRALCAGARDVRDHGDDRRPDELLARALELAERVEDPDTRDLLRARALFDQAERDLWHSRKEAAEERLQEVIRLLADRVLFNPSLPPDDNEREAGSLHSRALSLLVEDRRVN